MLCSICNRKKSDKLVSTEGVTHTTPTKAETVSSQSSTETDFKAFMQETREFIKSYQNTKKETSTNIEEDE